MISAQYGRISTTLWIYIQVTCKANKRNSRAILKIDMTSFLTIFKNKLAGNKGIYQKKSSCAKNSNEFFIYRVI